MKRLIALFLVALLMLSAFTACDSSAQNEETTENSPEETTVEETAETTEDSTTETDVQSGSEVVLAKDGTLYAPLVRSDKTNPDAKEVTLITAARRRIIDTIGLTMEYKTDYIGRNETYDPATIELLIGKTNREESVALQEEIGKYGYAIRTTETKVMITASRAELLERALNLFFEKIESGEYGTMTKDTFTVKKGINLVVDCSDEYALDIKLKSSNTLQATTTQIGIIPSPSGTWPQGGYTDGTYYYQAFILRDYENNEKNNVVTIVKWNMENGQVAQQSGSLELNHCNDITYNPNLNQFIVCHNNPVRTKISFIDPQTLTVVESKTLAYSIYCIDYNAARNEYVIGVSGGQTFRILDENFNSIRGAYQPTRRTAGYTTQGVTCDENYIYFVLYKQNVITVYDWSGKFVTLIKLDVGNIEPENLGIFNDTIYISCGYATGKGSKVFRIDELTTLPSEKEPPETTQPSNEDA